MTPIKRKIPILFIMTAFLCVCCGAEAGDKDDAGSLPTITITVGTKKLEVEIASTAEQRRVGLMNRKSMPENHGMIFVFDPPEPVSFWMKNTYIPLSAAFVAEDGVVVKIADMQPLSETHHAPDVDVQFVIEVNRGWFKKAGLGVGSKLRLDLDKIQDAAGK